VAGHARRLGAPARALAAVLAAGVLAGGCGAAAPPSATATVPPVRTATPVPGLPGGIASASGAVQAGFTRYSGTVTDDQGAPLAGVCVYAGPASGCPTPSLITDAAGKWAFDFPSGLVWQFNFEHPAYEAKTGITGQTISVQLTKKAPKP